MGAACSVRSVYADAVAWFRQYFDTHTYVADFHSIDKDHDGGIRYAEFVSWLQTRAVREGGPWLFFVSHPEIVATAHLQASKFGVVKKDTYIIEKIVDITDFRQLLIHLFVVSILWTHFKKADDWQSVDRNDSYDGRLNLEECMHGVRSFCAAYSQEVLSDDEIRRDFQSIDTDGNGQLTLLEVCSLCSKLVDLGPMECFALPDAQPRSKLALRDEEMARLKEAARRQHMEELDIAETITSACYVGNCEDVERDQQELVEMDKVSIELEFEAIKPYAGSVASTEAMTTVLQEVSKNANIAEFMEMKLATARELSLALVGTTEEIVLDD